ncbi:MAG: MATE family efflux transporter [Spirochaetaceae bacterium]|nr:MATE family efflux transporter [Spirochaetaceae bacterium]MBR4012374.1 MATE family efflux transporter [Spirochaetaceae bacterium]
MNGKLIKQLNFKTLFSIALPISIQSLLQSSLGMIDQIMIGQLGETAVASVNLGTRLMFIMVYSLSGISAVSSIYTSQYEGAGTKEKHSAVMKITILEGLLCVLPFLIAGLFFPQQIVRIFSEDNTVIQKGANYLFITAFGFIPKLFSISISAILRCTGKAKITLITGLSSVAINTVLNLIFIFGFGPIKAHGVEGAAIATVIAIFIEATINIIYLEKTKHPSRLSLAIKAKADKGFYKKFAITTLPAIGNECFWALGDAIYSGIYGHMSTVSLAAITLTFPIQGMSVGFFSGLSAAAGVIIGNNLGAKKTKEAYTLAWDFFKLCIIGCGIIGILIVLFGSVYLKFYNVTDEVKLYTKSLLAIFACYLWVKVSNMVMLGGVLRSGGKTRYTLILDLIGTWGIGIPLGFLCAFVFKWNILMVYTAINIEEVIRLTLGLIKVKSKDWISIID